MNDVLEHFATADLSVRDTGAVTKILSYGGGLDSFAMLVESIRRGCPPDAVVMCDVGAPGDLGEWPSTYRHVEEVVRPLCASHGIPFVMISTRSAANDRSGPTTRRPTACPAA
jgi:hypothetical protein